MAIEEHGAGRQVVRCEFRPRSSAPTLVVATGLLGLAAAAVGDGAPLVGVLFGTVAGVLLAGVGLKEATAMGHLLSAVESQLPREPPSRLQRSLEAAKAPAE
jgi:hypothetical protein